MAELVAAEEISESVFALRSTVEKSPSIEKVAEYAAFTCLGVYLILITIEENPSFFSGKDLVLRIQCPYSGGIVKEERVQVDVDFNASLRVFEFFSGVEDFSDFRDLDLNDLFLNKLGHCGGEDCKSMENHDDGNDDMPIECDCACDLCLSRYLSIEEKNTKVKRVREKFNTSLEVAVKKELRETALANLANGISKLIQVKKWQSASGWATTFASPLPVQAK